MANCNNTGCKSFIKLFYDGRSINKLQNSAFLLVFQMHKIRNIRFVGNFILSTSCEFYYDDVTVMLFINITYGDVATENVPQRTTCCYCFFVGKKLMQIIFTPRCIQYMATCVLQSQQYTCDVRKWQVGRNLHHIPRCNQSFFSGSNSCQHRSLHRAFRSLLTNGTNG